MTLKNQIANHLATAIRANVESLYAGRIEGAEFDENQRSAWSAAESHGVEDLLRNRLVELDNEAKAAKAAKEENSGSWSHRADLENWQDDFASDFEEND